MRTHSVFMRPCRVAKDSGCQMLKVSSWENLVDMAVSRNKQALGSIVTALRSPPNLDGGVNDQFELGPLLVFGEQVAFHRRGEAALRTEREIFQRHVPGRFADALGELVLGFHRR